jgi:hypothetical protein
MNFLKILFEPKDYDDIFKYLKRKFASDVADVSVDTLVPNQLVEIKWNGLLEPANVALEMTEAIPTIIIECPSTTGIDLFSRFFNKTQLY